MGGIHSTRAQRPCLKTRTHLVCPKPFFLGFRVLFVFAFARLFFSNPIEHLAFPESILTKQLFLFIKREILYGGFAFAISLSVTNARVAGQLSNF